MQETLLIWRSWEELGAFRRIRSDDDMMLNAAIALPHAEALNALPASSTGRNPHVFRQ